MAHTLTIDVNIGGTIHPAGTDVSDIATPGELASLRQSGYIDHTPGKARKPSAPPADPPADAPIEPTPSVPADEFPPAAEPIPLTELGIPARLLDLLATADPPIHTDNDIRAYIATHGTLTRIKGIGKATAAELLESIG